MKNYITWLMIPIMAVSLATPAGGQSIEETLEDLVSTNAKGYLGPFSTAFGTSMNSGTYHTARPHKILGFDVTINLAMTTVPEAALTYDFYIPDEVNMPLEIPEEIPLPAGMTDRLINIPLSGASLYPAEDRVSATIFGANESYVIEPSETYASSAVETKLLDLGFESAVVSQLSSEIGSSVSQLTLYTPKGIDFSFLPIPMPQFSLGLPLNTELTLRGFTLPLGDSGEDLSFSGYGLKIGLNQFIPTIPLVFPAVSVGYYATNMDLAGFITAQNSIINLQVSKSVPVLTLYGGFGLESSSIDVKVDNPDTGENILDFSLDGDNSFRTTVGLRIKLLLLSINVDYNMGEYSAINAGVGLTLR
ncbi:MAG: hypothetical protein JSU77_07210 [Fidelibacterota bacterium]|nr:MAG: hypothetical protein JSU77_07210 [Candidatus Neomarinimicrobiota bacterium]